MGDGNCTADGLENYLFPTEAELLWPLGLQITCHLIFLLWLFIGVGLASDTFMNSIEEITATKKTIRLKDGTTKEVDVWNPTVANLSLMALGSSAPEILLSCIELFTSRPVLTRTPRGPRTVHACLLHTCLPTERPGQLAPGGGTGVHTRRAWPTRRAVHLAIEK